MMRRLFVFGVTLALSLAFASPALAATTGAGGAGRDYGLHHAAHAREHTGFTAEMNPGVHHRGFSGWMEHMGHMGH